MTSPRKDFIQNAVAFLTDASVASASKERKTEFLKGKGLTEQEIALAFEEAEAKLATGRKTDQGVDESGKTSNSSQSMASSSEPKISSNSSGVAESIAEVITPMPEPPPTSSASSSSWFSLAGQAALLLAIGGVGWNFASSYFISSTNDKEGKLGRRAETKSRARIGPRKKSKREETSGSTRSVQLRDEDDIDDYTDDSESVSSFSSASDVSISNSLSDDSDSVQEEQDRRYRNDRFSRHRDGKRRHGREKPNSSSSRSSHMSHRQRASFESEPLSSTNSVSSTTPSWFLKEREALLDQITMQQRNNAPASAIISLETQIGELARALAAQRPLSASLPATPYVAPSQNGPSMTTSTSSITTTAKPAPWLSSSTNSQGALPATSSTSQPLSSPARASPWSAPSAVPATLNQTNAVGDDVDPPPSASAIPAWQLAEANATTPSVATSTTSTTTT